MSGAKFILPGERKSHHELEQSVFSGINNPRDQQQITVLVRQMYPGQVEKFLNTYRMATSKPFGYL